MFGFRVDHEQLGSSSWFVGLPERFLPVLDFSDYRVNQELNPEACSVYSVHDFRPLSNAGHASGLVVLFALSNRLAE